MYRKCEKLSVPRAVDSRHRNIPFHGLAITVCRVQETARCQRAVISTLSAEGVAVPRLLPNTVQY